MPGEINYCQSCGHRMGVRQVENQMRPCCTSCGLVVFMDPKVAAAVLVMMDGKLVMVRRGVEPALGCWAFPSGYVDRGEAVETAARREVKEETGLDVEIERLVGVYSQDGNPVVLAVYSGYVVGGALEPGHDVQEVDVFPLEDLPPLPFPHDGAILKDWQALCLSLD